MGLQIYQPNDPPLVRRANLLAERTLIDLLPPGILLHPALVIGIMRCSTLAAGAATRQYYVISSTTHDSASCSIFIMRAYRLYTWKTAARCSSSIRLDANPIELVIVDAVGGV